MGSSSMIELAMFPELTAAMGIKEEAPPAAVAVVADTTMSTPPPTISSTMDPAMYFAAKQGNVPYLISKTPTVNLSSFLTPQKNTVLHIAVRFLQLEFAEEVLRSDPSLLFQPNSEGDTPLHVAARYGHIETVRLLVSSYREQQCLHQQQRDLESGGLMQHNNIPITAEWIRATNSDGNTALHEALMTKNPNVVMMLLEEDPGLASCENNAMESPLYLAASSGFYDVVRRILDINVADAAGMTTMISLRGRNGQTPLHAIAMFKGRGEQAETQKKHRGKERERAKNRGAPAFVTLGRGGKELSLSTPPPLSILVSVLRLINAPVKREFEITMGQDQAIARLLCEKMPHEVTRQVDEFGRTALHYSAAAPSPEVTRILLRKDHTLAYLPDKDGRTPLFIAAALHHLSIVNIILEHCPDCGEFHDLKDQNVLHFLMDERKNSALLKVMRHPEMKGLLTESNGDGNTLLHLAAEARLIPALIFLLGCEGINLEARNRDGLTALDLFQDWYPLTTVDMALKDWSVVRLGAVKDGTKRLGGVDDGRKKSSGGGGETTQQTNDFANTFLVVATLFAAITFSALFQLPGGYSSDPPSLGTAVFGKRAAFKVFLLCDAIAFCSSLLSVAWLVEGMFRMDNTPRRELVRHGNLATVTVLATTVAFTAAAYLVTEPKSKFLAISVVFIAVNSAMIYFFRLPPRFWRACFYIFYRFLSYLAHCFLSYRLHRFQN